MISINTALDKIINESPFLEEGLYHEYINLTSFSEYIKPKIELITKKEVSIGAIKMALSRYIKNKQKIITYKRFDLNDFFIKKHINIIYTKNNIETFNITNINKSNEDFITIIQGINNCSIVFNDNLKEKIEKIINKKDIILKLNNLSLIGINLDENRVNEIGIVYTITKKINFSNINIIEIITSLKEIHFLVKDEDLKKTIESIML
nr:hypothetical protein [Candidatus Gracilibacteria bacterium]